MIPKQEQATLIRALLDAERAATHGKPVEGYEELLAGQRRAENATEMGEAWSADLVAWWRHAVVEYVDRHDLGPAVPPVPQVPPRS